MLVFIDFFRSHPSKLLLFPSSVSPIANWKLCCRESQILTVPQRFFFEKLFFVKNLLVLTYWLPREWSSVLLVGVVRYTLYRRESFGECSVKRESSESYLGISPHTSIISFSGFIPFVYLEMLIIVYMLLLYVFLMEKFSVLLSSHPLSWIWCWNFWIWSYFSENLIFRDRVTS